MIVVTSFANAHVVRKGKLGRQRSLHVPCSYYNWREGAFSDLQLFLLFNAAIITAGGVIKHSLLHGELGGDAEPTSNFFQDIYEAGTLLHADVHLHFRSWTDSYPQVSSCLQPFQCGATLQFTLDHGKA